MLYEIASSLNQYYLKPPSYLRKNKKNLVLNSKYNNEKNEMNNQYQYNSENIKPNDNINNLNNQNFKNQKIVSAKNRIQAKNAIGSNFTFKSGDIFTPSSQNNKINLNNIYKADNYLTNKNISPNSRPKSAIKGRVNINYNLDINNNKKSLIKNFKALDDDYDINSNMNKFENLINIIDKNGFQRYQDEINEKKLLISHLKNSIAILKNKISLCRNNIYNGFHRETKKKIRNEKMLSVGNRYKNVGKTAYSYKNEIDMMKNKIAVLNDETMGMKNIYLREQNEIEEINNEIKKGNKIISDRQKQIENILAATQLLKKHIVSVKQKIGRIKNVKYNYINEINYIGNNI